MLLHIVLFKFHPGTCPDTRSLLHQRLIDLGPAYSTVETGLLHWQVTENLDGRKGYGLMEVAVFDSAAAMQTFRGHPLHHEVASDISHHADWVVGDCPIAAQVFPESPGLGGVDKLGDRYLQS